MFKIEMLKKAGDLLKALNTEEGINLVSTIGIRIQGGNLEIKTLSIFPLEKAPLAKDLPEILDQKEE